MVYEIQIPIAALFLGYYKSLIINTYTQISTQFENCKLDDTSGYLINLKKLLCLSLSEDQAITTQIPNVSKKMPVRDNINLSAVAYIPHSVMTKITLTYTKNCETCRENINMLQKNNIYVTKIINITSSYLPVISHFIQFSKYVKEHIIECIHFEFLECNHIMSLKKTIIFECVDWVILQYFQDIRKVLKGKLHLNNGDHLMQVAENYYKKHCKNTNNI